MGEMLQQTPGFLTGIGVIIGALGLYRRRMAINAQGQFEQINKAYQDLAQLHQNTAKEEHRKRLAAEADAEAQHQRRRDLEAELQRLKK